MTFRPWPKKGLPPKKPRKPLKRTQVKRYKRLRVPKKFSRDELADMHKEKSLFLQARDLLDSVFSKYIRHKYSNGFGRVQCFTCPTIRPIDQMQNGHFITRKKMSIRYDEDNCRPQCKECNEYKDGNLEVYAARLGEEHVAMIKKRGRQTKKWTVDELNESIIYYRNELQKIARC